MTGFVSETINNGPSQLFSSSICLCQSVYLSWAARPRGYDCLAKTGFVTCPLWSLSLKLQVFHPSFHLVETTYLGQCLYVIVADTINKSGLLEFSRPPFPGSLEVCLIQSGEEHLKLSYINRDHEVGPTVSVNGQASRTPSDSIGSQWPNSISPVTSPKPPCRPFIFGASPDVAKALRPRRGKLEKENTMGDDVDYDLPPKDWPPLKC